MTEFRHGLVIGKFYPPHAGHLYLIRTAARHCDQVTVVAMPASRESIPMALRLDWLRECLADNPHVVIVGVIDDIPVDYNNADIWDAHVALMRQGIAQADKSRPLVTVDAVFSSEPYGEEMARYFNAVPVCLDQMRTLYPVSGTAVRNDPAANWDFLPTAVQAWLALRVVIVGAESTGKTTLAQNLSAHFRQKGSPWSNTTWVPEYGREYSFNKLAVMRGHATAKGMGTPSFDELTWHSEEFEEIARQQNRWENDAARKSGPLLIADTDAFATGIWHERYTDTRSAIVEAIGIPLSPYRLYLLTDVHSVSFEQDGIRDGEHVREWMHGRFVQQLDETGRDWKLVSGSPEEVVAQASEWIQKTLEKTWQFSPPLG